MEVDVIFLSYTKDLYYYGLTQRAISSLLKKNSDCSFNIILIETNKNLEEEYFFYNDCRVIIPPEEFNYNKFLNIGLQYCRNQYVIMCNNDIIFGDSSVRNLINTMNENDMHSACPLEPNWHKRKLSEEEYNSQFIEGYEVEKHIVGWCICSDRKMLIENRILDEKFAFWYQDNDYARSLQSLGIKHYLVNSSHVYHEFSASHGLLGDRSDNLTHGMRTVYEKKWCS